MYAVEACIQEKNAMVGGREVTSLSHEVRYVNVDISLRLTYSY